MVLTVKSINAMLDGAIDAGLPYLVSPSYFDNQYSRIMYRTAVGLGEALIGDAIMGVEPDISRIISQQLASELGNELGNEAKSGLKHHTPTHQNKTPVNGLAVPTGPEPGASYQQAMTDGQGYCAMPDYAQATPDDPHDELNYANSVQTTNNKPITSNNYHSTITHGYNGDQLQSGATTPATAQPSLFWKTVDEINYVGKSVHDEIVLEGKKAMQIYDGVVLGVLQVAGDVSDTFQQGLYDFTGGRGGDQILTDIKTVDHVVGQTVRDRPVSFGYRQVDQRLLL